MSKSFVRDNMCVLCECLSLPVAAYVFLLNRVQTALLGTTFAPHCESLSLVGATARGRVIAQAAAAASVPLVAPELAAAAAAAAAAAGVAITVWAVVAMARGA
eukprot:6188892-Pleurochrysis_carterae.AAC.8